MDHRYSCMSGLRGSGPLTCEVLDLSQHFDTRGPSKLSETTLCLCLCCFCYYEWWFYLCLAFLFVSSNIKVIVKIIRPIEKYLIILSKLLTKLIILPDRLSLHGGRVQVLVGLDRRPQCDGQPGNPARQRPQQDRSPQQFGQVRICDEDKVLWFKTSSNSWGSYQLNASLIQKHFFHFWQLLQYKANLRGVMKAQDVRATY